MKDWNYPLDASERYRAEKAEEMFNSTARSIAKRYAIKVAFQAFVVLLPFVVAIWLISKIL